MQDTLQGVNVGLQQDVQDRGKDLVTLGRGGGGGVRAKEGGGVGVRVQSPGSGSPEKTVPDRGKDLVCA